MYLRIALTFLVAALAGCGDDDQSSSEDAGTDAGRDDAGRDDAGRGDASRPDSGSAHDAGRADASPPDSGSAHHDASAGNGGTGGKSVVEVQHQCEADQDENDASTDSDSDSGVETTLQCCISKGGNLVLIGDSYVNYNERLEPRLTSHARMDGVLAGTDSFDDHAEAGTSLAFGATATLPNQWFDEAKALKPKFVVMDGGFSDLVLYNAKCLPDGVGNGNDQACRTVMTAAVMAAKTMWDDMKAAGVSDVLYFSVPHLPAGGNDILDWGFLMFKEACESESTDTFRCHFVDTRATFEGHPEFITDLDHIHPTAAGMDAMGAFIWQHMQGFCTGQSRASGGGCCTP